MSKCPTVHEHPEFKNSFDSSCERQNKQVEKLKRFLTSDVGHQIGESLKYELSPFKSFPRGHIDVKDTIYSMQRVQKRSIKSPM